MFLLSRSRRTGACGLAPALGFLFALALLSLAGCTHSLLPAAGALPSGRVEVAALLPASAEPGATARLTLSRHGMVRSVPLALEDGAFRGVAEGVPIGLWDVSAQLFDETGDVTHEGTGSVFVRASEEASLLIELAPKEAALEIVVDLASFPEAERVGKARVTFHTEQVLTLQLGEDGRFHGVKPLPPGDWDFSIGLYGSAFYASERVYESPWEHVTLHPGKTVRVVWQAATGSARVDVVVRHLPPAPQGLRVERSGQEARLVWEPVLDPQVTRYRVYARDGEGEPFEREAEVNEPVWPVPAALLNSRGPVSFVVTSVTADGRESYRSEESPLAP